MKSALLLASLKTDGINVIESQQTRDHTERMLTFMGFSVLRKCHAKRARTGVGPKCSSDNFTRRAIEQAQT
ncbi:hypothetical protein [Natranaerobius thermophilus]|uniref:hypothetical protein n=1 Tax=Natranaerobius thermophilus TaxID=375929 RepID=UPI002F42B7DC